MNVRAKSRRNAGLLLLALGVGFYLTFAIGEVAGGDITGIQHLLPAATLVALLAVAWRHTRVAGAIMLALAVPLGIVYVVILVLRDLPPTSALVVVLPPLVTGWLLFRAGQRERACD